MAAEPLALESMGQDAVQHSAASFYIFSLLGYSGLRYDPILHQLLMLPYGRELLKQRHGDFADRDADKNAPNTVPTPRHRRLMHLSQHILLRHTC